MNPIQPNAETDYDTTFPPCPGCGEGMVFFPEDTKQQEGAGHYECCYCGWSAPFRAGIGAAYARAMKRYVEPNRVLTVEECAALDPDGATCVESSRGEIETQLNQEIINETSGMIEMYGLQNAKKLYGKYGRCWLRRPTDAERKAAKWEAQP